jgi:hypothetical protein
MSCFLWTLALAGALAGCGNSSGGNSGNNNGTGGSGSGNNGTGGSGSGNNGTGGNGSGNNGTGGNGSGNNGTGGNGSGVDAGTNPGSPPPADLASPPSGNPFVGTWLYGTGGVLTSDCFPGAPPSDISKQTFTITLKDPQTISLAQSGPMSCGFDFTISGDTATVVPGQTCMVNAMGFMAQLTSKSGTFTTHDGLTGALDSVADVKSQLGTCHATISAPMSKKM